MMQPCPGCGNGFELPQWFLDNPDPKGKLEFCRSECARRHETIVEQLRHRLRISLEEGGQMTWTTDPP